MIDCYYHAHNTQINHITGPITHIAINTYFYIRAVIYGGSIMKYKISSPVAQILIYRRMIWYITLPGANSGWGSNNSNLFVVKYLI